ncbi:MAG TPA: hypothetical protein VHO71_05430 [Caproiciproducens sp.]|nr:hypothetical protein [Caproiciproducens sp.]
MQFKSSGCPVDSRKKVLIAVLFIFACAICASGVFFSVYSYVNQVNFQILNTKVPGIVFGLAVLYLGIRYLISLSDLKKEVYKPTSRFSWDHFKKEKHR